MIKQNEEKNCAAYKVQPPSNSHVSIIIKGGDTSVSQNHNCLNCPKTSQKCWIVTLYFITITILFMDMNLVAPNLTTIAEEFGMSDDERDVKLGGLIALRRVIGSLRPIRGGTEHKLNCTMLLICNDYDFTDSSLL
jgi:hypothetical protein